MTQRTALVTGGTGGIGSAIVRHLVKQGHKVATNYRDEAKTTAWVEALAQENAKFGITVNTVSPGYVATDMVMAVPAEVRAKIEAQIPLGRLGRPEEIAHAVAFLTGEETGWMTCANLAINGGQYMGW